MIFDRNVAIELHYSRIELSNADIKAMFGNIQNCTVAKLKTMAKTKMKDKGVLPYNPCCVNTQAAFEAWSLFLEGGEV